MRKKKILTYTVHIEPEPEGGFTVTVPALQGCVSYGKDCAQAVAMAQEVIEGFLEALIKAGQPIPHEPSPRKSADVLLQVTYPPAAL